jgi:hypothetical protein
MKQLLLAGIALALAGCGAREDLEPAAGKSLPVKPYAAKATPSPEKLLEAPPQTRPARSDDLIESSKERRSDEFDLPPE